MSFYRVAMNWGFGVNGTEQNRKKNRTGPNIKEQGCILLEMAGNCLKLLEMAKIS